MDVFFKVMGYLMAGAGGLGIIRYINTDNPSDLSMALGMIFFGLLVVGFGEVCKTLLAIEVNTRKPVAEVPMQKQTENKDAGA